MANPVGGAEAGEVTTTLTCRSSRILVSSFGRAGRSKAGTGSTFARQSEKRAKYGRKRGVPSPSLPLCRTKWTRCQVAASRFGLSLLLIPFRNSHLEFDSCLSLFLNSFSSILSSVEIAGSSVIVNRNISDLYF